MARKTIRAAQFMYYVPTGVVRKLKDGAEEEVLSVRHALHGDTVNIPRDEDVERGERAGAFEVEQESPAVEEQTTTGLQFSDYDALVGWFKDEQPTVTTVISAADGNPDKAQMLLAAENEASGGQPRKGVTTGLNRIIKSDEED
jgi:hypothetical protein